MIGQVLDASTIVGFAQELPYPQALVWTRRTGRHGARRASWARTPAGAQDALGVLLELPNTVVEPLDQPTARHAT